MAESSVSQSQLPLRIRVDVRDRFEASNSPAQKALVTLQGIIGLEASCDVDWNLLYATLRNKFPDKTTFVPTVADIIVAWCDVLTTRVEDGRFATWAENIVDMLAAAGSIRLRIQVLDVNRPMTAWSTDSTSFLLYLPRTSSFSSDKVSSGFESDFATLFVSEPSAVSTESLPVRNNDEETPGVDEASEQARFQLAHLSLSNDPEKIPSVATLPTPDILLRNLTPYILHVTRQGPCKLVEHGASRSMNQGLGRSVGQSSSTQVQSGGSVLYIQGTHGPSIQFLYQYLLKWIKRDHQDTRKCPLLQITLRESHFGLGINYDTLTIEPFDADQEKRGVEMNPTIVLALTESILGYRRLPSVEVGFWEFRRDVAFK